MGEELDESWLRDLEKRINPEQRRTLEESVRRLQEHPDDPSAPEEVRWLSRELDLVAGRSEVAQSKEGAPSLLGGILQGSMNALRSMTYYTMRWRAGIVGGMAWDRSYRGSLRQRPVRACISLRRASERVWRDTG
jgi:hypothetical protein